MFGRSIGGALLTLVGWAIVAVMGLLLVVAVLHGVHRTRRTR